MKTKAELAGVTGIGCEMFATTGYKISNMVRDFLVQKLGMKYVAALLSSLNAIFLRGLKTDFCCCNISN